MGGRMAAFAFHFASGAALFSGTAMILLAVTASWLSATPAVRIGTRVAATVGLLFAILSATPFPFWAYVALPAVVLSSLVAEARASQARMVVCLRIAALLAPTSLAALELPHQLTPSIAAGSYENLYVIGDSISAGVGEGERTWPQVLRERLAVNVVDLSFAGATVRTAQHAVGKVMPGRALVLLEIGGNDLLGRRPAAEFKANLRALLEGLRSPDRALVMFELPLPPFYNAYGRAQRALAREYGVTVIPKRLLSEVLAGRGSTLDGIHLSEKGHREMADLVQRHT